MYKILLVFCYRYIEIENKLPPTRLLAKEEWLMFYFIMSTTDNVSYLIILFIK